MEGQIIFQVLMQRFSDLAHARQLQRSIQVKKPSSKTQTAQSITFHATDVPQLLNLLSISTFYDFGLVREYAIRALEANGGLNPIEKICYANQCHIPEWLFTAYKELCRRSAPLEVSEAERIGLTTAILVAKARERVIRDQRPQPQYTSGFGSGIGTTFKRDEEKPDSVGAIVNSVFFNKEN